MKDITMHIGIKLDVGGASGSRAKHVYSAGLSEWFRVEQGKVGLRGLVYSAGMVRRQMVLGQVQCFSWPPEGMASLPKKTGQLKLDEGTRKCRKVGHHFQNLILMVLKINQICKVTCLSK